MLSGFSARRSIMTIAPVTGSDIAKEGIWIVEVVALSATL
jgi:hypothetical protein